MEHDLSSQAHRSRLAQFFAWVRGDQALTQQAQQQKSDRQVSDGTARGTEDPDARRAMRETAQGFREAMHVQRLALSQREGEQSAGADPSERTRASAHAWRYGTMDGYDAIRQDAEQRRADQGDRREPPSIQDDRERLRAALDAAQRQFEAQQRNQHRQHGRGR